MEPLSATSSVSKISKLCKDIEVLCQKNRKVQSIAIMELQETLSKLNSLSDHSSDASIPAKKSVVTSKTKKTESPRPPSRLSPIEQGSSSPHETGSQISNIFRETLKCYSITDDLEQGGNILLPPSCLLEMEACKLPYPIVLQLSNNNRDASKKVAYCGVVQFSEADGCCRIPKWMMLKLSLSEGSLINLRGVTTAPKATLIKIQASEDLMKVANPKAFLEFVLRQYQVLTKGDTIPLMYRDQKCQISIVDVLPDNKHKTVSIVDTDVKVEFVQQYAPSTVTPKPTSDAPTMHTLNDTEDEDTTEPFVPFTGTGYLLGSTAGPSKVIRDPNRSHVAPKKKSEMKKKPPKMKATAPPGFVPFAGKGYVLQEKGAQPKPKGKK